MEEFAAIPAITVICYALAELFKAVTNEGRWKHIPVLCAAVGGVVGVLCHQFLPGYIPAENVLIAAAVGIVSGIAATGAHQVKKQEGEEDKAA